jgi:hypothetical protein
MNPERGGQARQAPAGPGRSHASRRWLLREQAEFVEAL